MTPEESALITNLFERLRAADKGSRDGEAAALIDRLVAAQPSAAYYLVQTLLVQRHALDAAEARMRELEQASGGGRSFLGQGQPPAPQPPAQQPAAPFAPRPAAAAYAPAALAGSVPVTAPAGGGFLHSALTTAAGVAGGALLYDTIRSLFFHNSGPFGSYLGGGGPWGQGLGGAVVENNVVNNYYDGQGAQAGSDLGGGTGGGGVENASYDPANDQGLDQGLDQGADQGVDSGGDDGGGFDSASDSGGGDFGGGDDGGGSDYA